VACCRQPSPKAKKGQQALATLLAHLEESLAVRLVLIERLPDEHQKMILTNRYIRCCSWEDIGRRVGYVPRYAQRIHNQALEQLEAMLTETGC